MYGRRNLMTGAATGYPTVEDARKFTDAMGYGQPIDGYVPQRRARVVPNRQVAERQQQIAQTAVPSDAPGYSDQLAQAFMATNGTALARLGFDPDRIAFTEQQIGNVLGEYHPHADEISTSGRMPSTIVHESLHRGLQKLQDAGVHPYKTWTSNEENLVRALMDSDFPGIEYESAPEIVRNARRIADHDPQAMQATRDMLEQAAAELLAKQTPRGPR